MLVRLREQVMVPEEDRSGVVGSGVRGTPSKPRTTLSGSWAKNKVKRGQKCCALQKETYHILVMAKGGGVTYNRQGELVGSWVSDGEKLESCEVRYVYFWLSHNNHSWVYRERKDNFGFDTRVNGDGGKGKEKS